MDNKFSKVMAQRSNSDLIGILGINRQDYLPEALLAAEIEFENRKIAYRNDLFGREVIHELIFHGAPIDLPTDIDLDVPFDVPTDIDLDVSFEIFGEIFSFFDFF